LSFVAKKIGLLVVANEQIKEQIKEKITGFNIEVFGRDNMSTENCREFFLKISATKCDHDDFKKIHASLEAVVQKIQQNGLKRTKRISVAQLQFCSIIWDLKTVLKFRLN
jgi:phage gp16-like protein